jgi:PAS domain S-box-containing protein
MRPVQADPGVGNGEGRFEALLSSAVDGILIIRQDGIIETVNRAAAKLFGYEVAEFIGRNVKFLMPDQHRINHDTYLHNYTTTGTRKIIGIGREVTGRRKDGSIFPMHLSVGEFTEGGAKYFTGIIHDLTQRMEQEHALRQAQKIEAVGQLTGGVAHDFNNLLAVIIGNLEMLGDTVDLGEARVLLDEALKAADLGASLTARLLAFARRSPLEPQLVRLNSIVEGLSQMLERTLGTTIVLSTRLGADAWSVMADPDELQSALVNLAINARDAMPEGGSLTIETWNFPVDGSFLAEELGLNMGQYVAISISDTGGGMPDHVIERAFEPFFTTKAVGEGTGLGLSMVYGFTKQSGGEITIYSEIGKGTTVTLFLPRYQDVPQMTEQTQSHISPLAGGGGTILVVEDNDQVRRLTRQRLEALGYVVVDVPHGPAAVDLLAKGLQVDLVFTDLVMPGGMSGYEVARHVQDSYPGTRVLLTSGYAEDLMHGDKLAANNLKLLRKPYRQAALAEAVRDAMCSD